MAAILQSHLATRRGHVFSAYFSVTYLNKLYGKGNDFYAHAQTVDIRHSSPICQAPGYEANTHI